MWSGGTECTACNPRTIAALQRAGFTVDQRKGPTPDNPRYLVSYTQQSTNDGGRDTPEPCTCYSKRYDDPANPTAGFGAIMTCTSADQGCPRVKGCGKRFAIPYEDPKQGEGTDEEEQIYDERCVQIGSEMLFVFKTAKSLRDAAAVA